MVSNLTYLIEQVGKDKGIPKEVIIQTLEEAMLKAAQRKYGAEEDIEAQFNEELGEVELFQFKTVVEEVTDPNTEIPLSEAHQLDPDAMEGDSIGIKLETEDFGRIAAQVAKQVIIQRVRAAEREHIYNDYKDRKNELIAGSVRRIERGNIIVDLGRTEAILLSKDQSPREIYRAHDRILAYVEDVTTTTKGPQIILSRSSIGMLLKLFEMEVPEIAEGIVQVVSAAREAGHRSKIAVVSRDSDVDPVGACVGMKGTRVQNIVQELRGEKIDIVTWNPDSVRYVCNALAPAVVSQVLIDEEEHSMEITVPDDMLSLAIGKRGQNVRLASQLTGWRLDIQSESKVEKMAERARELFQSIELVDEELANTLTQLGFLSLEDLIRAEPEDLSIIPGLKADLVPTLVEEAIRIQRELEESGELERMEMDLGDPRRQKTPRTQPAAAPVADDRPELLRLKNVDEDLMQRLQEAGYYTIADLMEADFDPKEFSERFEVSMRKTRAILHSAKQKHDQLAAGGSLDDPEAPPEEGAEAEISPDGETEAEAVEKESIAVDAETIEAKVDGEETETPDKAADSEEESGSETENAEEDE